MLYIISYCTVGPMAKYGSLLYTSQVTNTGDNLFSPLFKLQPFPRWFLAEVLFLYLKNFILVIFMRPPPPFLGRVVKTIVTRCCIP